MTHFYSFAKKTLFLLGFSFISYQSNAQSAAFGGGIGINSIFGNGVVLPQNKAYRLGSGTSTQKAFSKPQMSLTIDYNFPSSVANKWLGFIYNPIFSNKFVRFRGQVGLNQYRITANKNNSILTFGGSFLYFPMAYNAEKKMNLFVESGYKAAFNNASFNPFNCLVMGIGSRHKMGNDWIIQTNLNYTWAFSDAVDQVGTRNYTFKNSDGFAAFNVSFLKSFFSKTEKTATDAAKDSIGMARAFAFQAIQKGQNVIEHTKSIQELVKPLLDKTQADKAIALKLSETAFGISDKAISARLNLQKGRWSDATDRQMDSLKKVASSLVNNSVLDYRRANDVRVIEQEVAKKVEELQRELEEAKQNQRWSFQYLPTLKTVEKEVQKLNMKEGGDARTVITKVEQAMAAAEKEFENAKTNVAETINSFEKASKSMKNALEDIERTKKEIAAFRR